MKKEENKNDKLRILLKKNRKIEIVFRYIFRTHFIILGCVWESLSIAYLSLSSHISTFDKNCRCLKELIKIAYDSPISHF